MSVYSHFLARGRDVVYPKDMSMILDLGTRTKQMKPIAGDAFAPETLVNLRMAQADARLSSPTAPACSSRMK
jgi:hypothetical protein